MTQRPPDRPDPGDDPGRDPGERPGAMRPLGPAWPTVMAVLGLVGGWLLHPIAERVNGTAPMVTWLQVGVLYFVAAVLAVVARHTWQALQQHRLPLEGELAVNRLVLARTCLLVGALVAGGYAGYAVSWLGVGAELAGVRLWRSLAASLAGVMIVVASVALERACRTRSDEERS